MLAKIIEDLENNQNQTSFLNRVIHERNQLSSNPAICIPCIGGYFSEEAYEDHVLDQNVGEPEKLVIDLRSLDCMTLIEYVEAIRRSPTMQDFVRNLIHVRYRNRVVDYTHRRHFFSNWVDVMDHLVTDVTTDCGGNQARQVQKILNQKEDGSRILPGVPTQSKIVSYIPTEALNTKLLENIQDGDYIGIYSPLAGLDVTHVGIMVRRDSTPFLRHAHSVPPRRQVTDHPFLDYLHGKFSKTGTVRPGVVVFRAAPYVHEASHSDQIIH